MLGTDNHALVLPIPRFFLEFYDHCFSCFFVFFYVALLDMFAFNLTIEIQTGNVEAGRV